MVGKSVGLGVGMVDGIALGAGVGAIEGPGDGNKVVGNLEGRVVGEGVGAQVSQYKSISTSFPLLELYILHILCSSGGVFVHIALPTPYMPKIPDSVWITHDPPSLQEISLPS